MNKKAMVFSVMVILALVVCFVILQSLAKIESQNKDFRVNRAQLLVFDHFVRDFDSYFIEEILRSAAKPALAELSQSAPFTKKDVVDLMEEGIFGSHAIDSASTTEASLNNALNTLSFDPEQSLFSYKLASVHQLSYDEIQLEFECDYTLSIQGNKWQKTGKQVALVVDVYSMHHPAWGAYGEIDDSWVEDTESSCYVEQLFSDVDCTKHLNIKPKIVTAD